METLNYMFDERNPNNLIKLRRDCMYICGIIGNFVLVAGAIVALHYTGTYLLFGFIIAGSPNYNRVSGCPIGMDECPAYEKKMLCYQEDMYVCHKLGLLTILGVALYLYLVIIIITRIYDITSSTTPEDIKLPEKNSEIIDVEPSKEENILLDNY